MIISSLGDLAMSFQLRRDTSTIKNELIRATSEISSGTSSDITAHLKGDFTKLSGIETELVRLEGYQSNISEYELVLTTQQSVMQKLRDLGTVSATFLTLPDDLAGASFAGFGNEGLSVFTSALNSLNTQVGGRTVFSGSSTNQPAVVDADSVLSALEAEISISGATAASDIEAIVNTWFSSGGGFDTLGYVGGSSPTTSVQLSDSDALAPIATAQAEPIRDYLAALSLGALVGRGLVSIDQDDQSDLIRRSGERLLTADESLIGLQSEIGRAENALERASVEVTNQMDALKIARSGLIEIDPYDAATELQNAEARLTTIYTLTGRLSRLSLAEYL